jgi:hypothetical protein
VTGPVSWFDALAKELAAPHKRVGLRLKQDDAEQLLLLMQAARDVSEHHERGMRPAGSRAALDRFYAEEEPLFDRLRDALTGNATNQKGRASSRLDGRPPVYPDGAES